MAEPINFDEALNEEQLAAVFAPDGPVLVIAAAGTGKTRTLIYRVAHLVERGIDPRRILLLTFTNRAAREMLERAERLVGESVGGLWGGTFHHMANRILRRHADALGYRPDYTILDRDDSRSLLRGCIEELGLKGKHFPKPDVLMGLYGLAASTERPVESIARDRFERHPISIDEILNVHKAYETKKRDLQVMDFDDLLVNGLGLFREHAGILDRYQDRFLYLLVDEYQDTNHIQAAWVDLFAGRHRNVLVVGDDFQSIYSWRGADFRNILTFPERYADAKVFKLETNYRSVPEILEVANACIAGNPEQFQKSLKARRESYKKPRVVYVRDGQAQARFVIGQVMQLRRDGYRMSDIMVLYRSHFQAMELQLELARERIPYVITSGARFFEQAHIKDVCAILRLLANPGDELAFFRLVELFPRVGRRTAVKLWRELGGRLDIRDAEALDLVAKLLPAAARDGWTAVEPVLRGAVQEQNGSSMADLIGEFVEAFYDAYAVETFDNYARRLEDIEELVNFTTRFDSVEAFLSEIALATNLDAEDEAVAVEAGDVMRLSTIHQAKGLEWGVVFILWLADQMFPSGRALNEGGEGEERRLFYVATTRAKDELFLCVPECRRSRDGGVVFYSPSRFVQEISPDLLDELRGFF